MDALCEVHGRPPPIVVIGRRNPNSDSVLSAVAYAHFLRRFHTNRSITAAAAGHINRQALYILDRFKTQCPEVITDITLRASYFNQDQLIALVEDEPLSRALELYSIYKHNTLPVVDADYRCLGQISLTDMFSDFLRPHSEKALRTVTTSLHTVKKTVRGRIVYSGSPTNVEAVRRYTIFIPVTAKEYFEQQTRHMTEQEWRSCIFIIGNHPEILESIIRRRGGCVVLSHTSRVGVSCEAEEVLEESSDETTIDHLHDLVESAGRLSRSGSSSSVHGQTGRMFTDDLISLIRGGLTCVIQTDMAVAAAAILVKQSTPIGFYVNKNKNLIVSEDVTLTDIRERFMDAKARAACVIDSTTKKLTGVVTDTDLTRETMLEVVLVDHNDLNEAVHGIKSAGIDIVEIIDHHRLNNPATTKPIKVTIDHVGSTCTIIAKMYRDNGIVPPINIAGIMLAGIICDTNCLKAPSTTLSDRKICEYLCQIVGVSRHDLAQEIFKATSVLANCEDVEELLRANMTVYEIPDQGSLSGITQSRVGSAVTLSTKDKDKDKTKRSESRKVTDQRFCISELSITSHDLVSPSIFSVLGDALDSIRIAETFSFAMIFATHVDQRHNQANNLLIYSGPDALAEALGYHTYGSFNFVYQLFNVHSKNNQLVPHIMSTLDGLTKQGVWAPMTAGNGTQS
ncbi:putative Manganese-dependent inorganic pyrophosphatase [Giardia muris]|uniref:Putative Manganese-dependent inorganic pyrophosphatase n=1 Tax=Giardia muris TaxID=5742 RepID=A0A4Z1T5A4_GIAMU|nr:putative Manganese-dependent inorganic pyrophosphatase [Giardia muris]|eukprot:TNJ27641.1 putative Manganese-dependent inorganic pyrophosphatase [Giardia muris]